MTRRLLLTAAALAFVLAGCGDDDDTATTADDSSTTDDVTTTTAADPGAADGYGAGESSTTAAGAGDDGAAGGSKVTVSDFAFGPGTIEVTTGATVTWSNEDGVGHTVTSGVPDSPDGTFEESLDAGGEVEVTFEEPGTYAYFCTIHTTMTGEVVVS